MANISAISDFDRPSRYNRITSYRNLIRGSFAFLDSLFKLCFSALLSLTVITPYSACDQTPFVFYTTWTTTLKRVFADYIVDITYIADKAHQLRSFSLTSLEEGEKYIFDITDIAQTSEGLAVKGTIEADFGIQDNVYIENGEFRFTVPGLYWKGY